MTLRELLYRIRKVAKKWPLRNVITFTNSPIQCIVVDYGVYKFYIRHTRYIFRFDNNGIKRIEMSYCDYYSLRVSQVLANSYTLENNDGIWEDDFREIVAAVSTTLLSVEMIDYAKTHYYQNRMVTRLREIRDSCEILEMNTGLLYKGPSNIRIQQDRGIYTITTLIGEVKIDTSISVGDNQTFQFRTIFDGVNHTRSLWKHDFCMHILDEIQRTLDILTTMVTL